ncbi:hypothetical protein PLESTB_000755400 [Pleodorina starrii]|uniref:Uncharacterized protein n=1 Tax=Pleodorina starrii TaxID=330485 RepID=A0A9W6F2R2_9CHLO|nr:hypothetical protein PLESTB_000755400 [Pleodorina starrii]
MVAGRFQRASAGSGVVASATSSAQPSEAQSLDMHNFNFTEEEARNLRRFWDAELYSRRHRRPGLAVGALLVGGLRNRGPHSSRQPQRSARAASAATGCASAAAGTGSAVAGLLLALWLLDARALWHLVQTEGEGEEPLEVWRPSIDALHRGGRQRHR